MAHRGIAAACVVMALTLSGRAQDALLPEALLYLAGPEATLTLDHDGYGVMDGGTTTIANVRAATNAPAFLAWREDRNYVLALRRILRATATNAQEIAAIGGTTAAQLTALKRELADLTVQFQRSVRVQADLASPTNRPSKEEP